MTQKRSRLLSIAMLCIAILVSGCGKVTQVTKKDEVNKAFKVTFTIATVSTANQNAAIAATTPGGIFTIQDTPLYIQLSGISDDGKKDELAWGRAELTSTTETPAQTENEKSRNIQPKPELKTFSTAFRKDGVKITKENHQWGYLSFIDKTKIWQGDFALVPQTYPVYLLVVYTETGKAAMKVFLEGDISKKADINLGNITAYDTFLAGLFLIDLQESKSGLKETFPQTDLSKLFSSEVFNSLNFSPLPNTVKQFRAKSPIFIFKRDQETDFLDLMNLATTQDLTEIDIFLTKLKRKKVVSDKTALLIKKNAELFRKDAAE